MASDIDSVASEPYAETDTPPPYSKSATSEPIHIQRIVKRQSTPRVHAFQSPESPVPPPQAAVQAQRLPPSAQRAHAPLEITHFNTSITTTFIILPPPTPTPTPTQPQSRSLASLPPSSPGPMSTLDSIFSFLTPKSSSTSKDRAHVSLTTSNSKIDTALYISDARWGRPFTTVANTSNARLSLALYPEHPLQPIDVRASTSNAHARLLLPASFHGLLILSTINARCALSPALRERSVRLPCGEEERSSLAEWYEIGGPGGLGRAEVRTSNAKAEACVVGEEVGAEEKSCVVM